MNDIIEEKTDRINMPQFSVTEISNAIKNVMEGAFSYVRVRGELSKVTVAKSGHLYTDLKDDKSVLSAICWKGVVDKLQVKPEEGMDVICTGRITTYPGRSNYQLIIERMELAGEGALLKMLEERKRKLAAEGLFDASRKKPIPFLPDVIGVVTSPTGAVIRDIMHRIEDRFPRRILLWPVMVQGEGTVKQVVEAINGFNAMPVGGEIPRPDVIIVARGGGSLEDLMPFNDEAVVRAVAASDIPVISAVGHETDTTLIDYAADKRAPTPTGAAEMAVPVRSEMSLRLHTGGERLNVALRRMTENVTQRFDFAVHKLDGVLVRANDNARARFDRIAAGIIHPKQKIAIAGERLNDRFIRLAPALERVLKTRGERLESVAALLRSYSYHGVLERGFALVRDAKTGAPITRAAGAKQGQNISITFADGEKQAILQDGEKQGRLL